MGESSNQKRMLVHRSNDDAEFEIEESMPANGSGLIRRMIEDECTKGGVPLSLSLSLSQINGAMLAKVVKYWRHHSESDEESKELKRWDAKFAEMDNGKISDTIYAANFLESHLLDFLCQSVVDRIKNMSVEEVRDKNAWAFE